MPNAQPPRPAPPARNTGRKSKNGSDSREGALRKGIYIWVLLRGPVFAFPRFAARASTRSLRRRGRGRARGLRIPEPSLMSLPLPHASGPQPSPTQSRRTRNPSRSLAWRRGGGSGPQPSPGQIPPLAASGGPWAWLGAGRLPVVAGFALGRRLRSPRSQRLAGFARGSRGHPVPLLPPPSPLPLSRPACGRVAPPVPVGGA